MVVSNRSLNKKKNFFTRFRVKTGKIIAQYAPINKIRILGLKLCGFKIGEKVYIGPDLVVVSILDDTHCFLEIGDRVAIGPRVTIVLSSDANWSNLNQYIKPIKGKVLIKNDSWIGAGSIILPNVIVNEMSIVGAGAVVTKDVPAFTIIAGVPAKIINKIPIRS